MTSSPKSMLLATMLATLAFGTPANGALTAVSGTPDPAADRVLAGGDPAAVSVSLAHGFPLWYEDEPGGLKLGLCLDQATATPGGTILPCLTAQPFPDHPISFPNNFGPEAFYWAAVAFEDRAATVAGASRPWSALLVLAQEAAFANGIIADGQQSVFGRIRIRIAVPAPGTYRVTHPYGTRDYVVADPGAERDVNQTQDLGILAAGDFTVSLGDRDLAAEPLPPFPQPAPPSLSFAPNGAVDSAGRNIGPFLRPTSPVVVATNGNRYLADPGDALAHRTVAVTGGPFGNVFSIELVGDAAGNVGPAFLPPGVVLNAADNSQVAVIDRFQVMGKLFDDGPNAPPVAGAVAVATPMNRPLSIDVSGAVSDDPDDGNRHGVDPQAIGIRVSPAEIRRTAPFTTANGGTVRRFTNISTGKATFTYTPAAGFTGTDTFQYVVQDTGGLISAPATVTVTVENLSAAGASFREKFGKWRIEGTSSDTGANVVTVHTDPVAFLSAAGQPAPVASQSRGLLSLAVQESVIDFRLVLDPKPSSAVTAVHIRLGNPGASGPVLFTLFDDFDGAFAGSASGRLDASDLQQPVGSGIASFADAVSAILSGNAYVNVHTAAFPAGEVRGQLSRRLVGAATVAGDGSWTVAPRTRANPFGVTGVHATSANGVRLLGIPLRLR